MKMGWEEKKLGEVCEMINRGVAPKYTKLNGLCVLNQRCIREHRINFDLSRFHDLKSKDVAADRFIQIGDVLVNSTGTGTLGRVAQVKDLPVKATVDSHITIVRPMKEKFYNDFFGYALMFIEEEIAKTGMGCGGQTELARNTLKDHFRISYPTDLPTQKRIADILDRSFAATTKAKENAEKNLKNARELFGSYLQSIFEKHENDWEEKKLKEVCVNVEYGTSAKSQKTGKIPVLRMGNIQSGRLNWNNLVFTSDDEEIRKYALKKNDILFNRTNSEELVGKTAIYKGERPAIFAGYLIRINIKKDILDADFLNMSLNSKKLRKYGFSVMTSSVNQANISGSKLKEYPLIIPPLTEQKRIVAQLNALASETKKLKAIYQQKIADLEELKKSILQKAFNGELTGACS